MAIRQVVDGQAGLPTPDSTKSYWHKEPSKKLLGHRTTPDLPDKADYVIVGSGITGAFAAHFLKNGAGRAASVVMLEAREACWGATGRNGGHCQPFLYTAEPEAAHFELETYRFLRDFVAERQVPCDWQSRPGVHALLSEDLVGLVAAHIAVLQRTHPDIASQVELVRDGARLAGELRLPTARAAVVQRNAASLWPYKLVAHVLESLLAEFPSPSSFNLQTATPVTRLERTAGSQTHPWTLHTPRGRVAAATVLLATNGYTSRLLPCLSDIITPCRSQVAALTPPPAATTTTGVADISHSYVFFGTDPPHGRDDYLIQRPLSKEPTAATTTIGGGGGGGELILGGGREHARNMAVGEWRDDEVEPRVGAHLRAALPGTLDMSADPGSSAPPVRDRDDAPLEATFEWTGIMGFSRDHRPWVGAVPACAYPEPPTDTGTDTGTGTDGPGGLYLCAAYTGHGMPVAALAARAVVNMMTGTTTPGDDGEQPEKLPASWVMTEERLRRARDEWDTIAEFERKGLMVIAGKPVSLLSST